MTQTSGEKQEDPDGGRVAPDFWSSRCTARQKQALMAVLTLCFAAITVAVYVDPSEAPALSEQAEHGRWIWHRHNCQSCHQFYGFGGFLGPDLTNAHTRVSTGRLRTLLTHGVGVMPAFHLEPDEIAAVGAFLRAMHETGQGQAKAIMRAGADPGAQMRHVIREEITDVDGERIRRGYVLFQIRGCGDCHIPLLNSAMQAPDLQTVGNRLEPPEILDVIEHGRPPDMPPTYLSSEDRDAMYAFLTWFEQRQDLRRRAVMPSLDESRTWSEVPWWEFGR